MTVQSIGQTGLPTEVQTIRSKLLRRTLLGNAAFSTLCALLFLLWAKPLATYFGFAPWVLTELGLIVLPFAAFLAWTATRSKLDHNVARIIFALDVAWVVSSVLMLLLGIPTLTSNGKWGVAIVADLVALFALLEYIGLRATSKQN